VGDIGEGRRPGGVGRCPRLRDAVAVAAAFRRASSGDVVVIAGKGHEVGQTIGDRVLPFDDKVVAIELLELLGRERSAP